ncbi:MAG: LacI family DNA-binding transcriptional regulator [Planctomycetota bacterium]|jgi:GntR family transcriptional regulator of arabinose operon
MSTSQLAKKAESSSSNHVAPRSTQIYQEFIEKFESGEFVSGTYLAPEGRYAEEYGVSVGTMKNVMVRLKENGYVTRQRGHGTMVTYEPASRATSNMIVILLERVSQSFYSEIYSGIQDELVSNNYSPILIETLGETEKLHQAIKRYDSEAAGFIFMPELSAAAKKCYQDLAAQSKPFIFLDRYITGVNAGAVVSDNISGGYLATLHMIEQGHKKIALMGETDVSSIQDRIRGYQNALKEEGLDFDPGLVFSAEENTFESSFEMTDRMLEYDSSISAVVCMRDDIAWGCIQHLTELGIDVPGQISVTGYDDNEDICSRIRPALTTVRQPKEEMGRHAAARLIRLLEGDNSSKEIIEMLPVELIVRQSTSSSINK